MLDKILENIRKTTKSKSDIISDIEIGYRLEKKPDGYKNINSSSLLEYKKINSSNKLGYKKID